MLIAAIGGFVVLAGVLIIKGPAQPGTVRPRRAAEPAQIDPAGMGRYEGPGCKVGGCSGQMCGEAGDGEMVSTCEFRAEYACYQQYGRCEKQIDGRCGWSNTSDFMKCFEQVKSVPDVEIPPDQVVE